MNEIVEWFEGRLPEEWFDGAPAITVDREEILVVGRLKGTRPDARRHSGGDGEGGDGSDAPKTASAAATEAPAAASGSESTPSPGSPGSTAAAQGRISRFREETRRARMRIADEAEARFGRKVAWGASYGDVSAVFTSLSVPVMTRLRQPERLVLDTLVAAGVARSRSEALAWCVRLVGRNEDAWIARLREALEAVERARAGGPRGEAAGRGQTAPSASSPSSFA